MEDAWTARWDDRFKDDAYAYGEDPNEFLQQELIKLPPGNILFPAEGEGRNAVFAAKLGWNVTAFDISKEGKHKADKLANKHGVSIDYQIKSLPHLDYKEGQFDVVALVYAHFPALIKSDYHKALDHFLKPGGTILFEAFSKKHLAYNRVNEKVGGPRDIESLFSMEEIKTDFSTYDIRLLEEKEIRLQEGIYHQGIGSVIRFIGSKQATI